MNLKDLLIALDHAPDEPRVYSKDPELHNPYGTGHLIHLGQQVKCDGTPDADGNPFPDSKHLVGKVTAVPDVDAHGKPVEYIPTERADEATFEVTQTDFDLNNPVCTVCGATVSI